MKNQTIINKMLTEQWQYFPDKELLVLAIGDKEAFKKQGLIDKDGYLDAHFKDEFTLSLSEKKLLIDTVGPFDDDNEDYFSGIINEDDVLQYFFEIHKITQENVMKFKQHYAVIFIVDAPQETL